MIEEATTQEKAEYTDAEKQIMAAEARKEALDKDFEILDERMKDEKYKDQGYKKGTTIEIDSVLFSEFINAMAHTKGTLVQIQQNLAIAYSTIDMLMDVNAELTIKMMNQHLDNVDKGVTVPNSQLVNSEKNGK